MTAGGAISSTRSRALAPWGRHLHVHDSFGRQDDIWMYTHGERIAYGHGDLHLPVGWGDNPRETIIAECEFPNIELQARHWHSARETADATNSLAERARTLKTARAA
ncbi:hypothetical protein [Aquibium oceanicum]|uniref:Xylose isomerase-like TIM barrel domain-containing protein n=1 Tax=Aquibium oceanicum TaxID=1670800 RepID=A0A1L3SW14_9HYPH|nr:hypothetical protein [Aquibium oceanicum]APH73578.1 hypothetical protein BSQ44_21015 [Aquibium oceanicum]